METIPRDQKHPIGTVLGGTHRERFQVARHDQVVDVRRGRGAGQRLRVRLLEEGVDGAVGAAVVRLPVEVRQPVGPQQKALDADHRIPEVERGSMRIQ